MAFKMRSPFELARSVRKSPVPPSRTIASKKDKAERAARRKFRQNRNSEGE